jgi:hypothetical protein
MAASGIDIIGDIHGMHTRLVAMLDALGYRRAAGRWTHDESRKIVFVGDYVDRGARVAEVVELVRELCDHRVALALAGNHDTNAIAFATRARDHAFDAAAAWQPVAGGHRPGGRGDRRRRARARARQSRAGAGPRAAAGAAQRPGAQRRPRHRLPPLATGSGMRGAAARSLRRKGR